MPSGVYERQPAAERFFEKVSPCPNTGCWLWTGSWTGNGYGCFWSGSRRYRAHRFSYEVACGPIPRGLGVLHKCDVRFCVNPDHLFIGTKQDNSTDMRIKARGSKSAAGLPRGVWRMRSGRYGARIYIDRRYFCLGSYDTATEASAVVELEVLRRFK